jgi:hypothetical protein
VLLAARKLSEVFGRQRRYQQRKSAEAAELGEIPAVADPARREACRLDLHKYLITYFPASTGLYPFSSDHKRGIKHIEQCILHGGRFLEAVYRGWAKTTILENSMLWATKYGHRRFVIIFGADSSAAERNISSIKTELAENDLLLEDFPEVCHAIRALEGKPQRCAGQCQDGRLTHVRWTSDTIVLPTIEGSAASGAIISAKGITAASRGMKFKRPDGRQQRPDFAAVDDPQTDESARSPSQVQTRIGLVKKNILKLGGHDTQLAAVIAATVIEKDDMIDQMMDPKKHPGWQGERIKMVRKWADAHDTLWMGTYRELRTSFDPDDPDAQLAARARATEFYRNNRAKMDAGAEVSWDECYDRGAELSAIQHAYNILIDDGAEVFESECQNSPQRRDASIGQPQLDAGKVSAKATTLARGIVPLWATHLTAFVDVQDRLLYAGVCAFRDGFRAHVVDYLTFPDQGRSYFTYRDAKKFLQKATGATSLPAALQAGLTAVTDALIGKRWQREDGAEMAVQLALIDAGDGDHADTVYEFCRRSRFAGVLLPSKGRGIGAAAVPWEQYKAREGERLGYHWSLARLKNSPTRLATIDTNFWKTFLSVGLAAPIGDTRSVEFFTGDHRMIADHLTAEFGIKTEGRGRTLTEWRLMPGRENHFLDVLVGCHVAASMAGVRHSALPLPLTRRGRSRGPRVSPMNI